jgi:hypothetical protein
MRAKTPWILSGLLAIALAVATTFAVWASAGDAPWETGAERPAVPTVTTPVPTRAQPAFSESEVLKLVQGQFLTFPCESATYKSQNQLWIVDCGPLTLLFDDRTGRVR